MNRTGIAAKGALAAGVLAASLTLSGCFANPLDQLGEQIAQGQAEDFIKGVTGGEVDVDLSGGLPEDFPAGVPLPDAKITTAGKVQSGEGGIWMVYYEVSDATAALEQARQQLTSAGFEEIMWNMGGTMMGIFQKGELNVAVGGSADEGVVAYTVTQGKEG